MGTMEKLHNDEVTVVGPHIDRLTIVMDIQNPDEQEFIMDKLFKQHDWGNSKKSNKTCGYSYAFNHSDELGDHYPISIQAVAKSTGIKSFLRFAYNPMNVSTNYMSSIINEILPGGYLRFTEEGRLKLIDAKYDFINMDINELVVYPGKSQKTSMYLKSAHLESQRFGDRASPLSVLLYDKNKQLKKIGKLKTSPIPYGKLARLEATIKPDKEHFLTLKSLQNMVNPFESYVIAPKSIFPLDTREQKLFVEVISARGLRYALQYCSDAEKKQFMGLVRNNSCAWFDSEALWKKWKDEVAQLIKVQC